MTVVSQIDVYEIDNMAISPTAAADVLSHLNDKDKVRLNVGGKTYTFLADELKRAIANAQNAHPF